MKHWQRINLKNIQATPAAQFQKNKWPNKKWAKELNRHFSKEDIQMANKYMKRCSISLVNNKWKLRYYLTYVRMATKKKPKTKKEQVLLKVWRKKSHDTLLVGMWNGTATMKDNMEFPQKTELLKCCLVFQEEGMSFGSWFESWENFRFRLSPLFAIFRIILGPDFPFLKNRGKNVYLAESLKGFS